MNMMKDLNAMIAKANAMEHFPVDSKFYNDEGGYAPGAKKHLPKVMKAVAAYLAPNGVAADMGIMPGSSVHKILFGTLEERREVANIMRTYVMQSELMNNEDVLHAVRYWVEEGELRNIRPVWTRIAEIIDLKPEDGVKNGEVWCLINSVVLIERISEEELSRNTRLVMMILEAYGCNGWT
ncbi:hypothetical protein SIPHO018v1_60004, partial [Vibrio phage 11E33.1]